jgi:hypothetical protein
MSMASKWSLSFRYPLQNPVCIWQHRVMTLNCTKDWKPWLHCKHAIFVKLFEWSKLHTFLLWSAAVSYHMYPTKINIILKFIFIIEKFLHKNLQPPRATRYMGNLSLVTQHAARWHSWQGGITSYVTITTVRAQHNCLTNFMCAFSHITKMSDPRAVLWLFTERVNILMHFSTTDAPRKHWGHVHSNQSW